MTINKLYSTFTRYYYFAALMLGSPFPLFGAHNDIRHDPSTLHAQSAIARAGIFGACGCGTYMFTGPSKSGKNVVLEKHIRLAMRGITPAPFTQAVVISATGHINRDWDFLKDLLGRQNVFLTNDASKLSAVKLKIESQVKTMKDRGADYESWLRCNGTLIIVNDMIGITNMSNITNDLLGLASMVRHLGAYLVIQIQHATAVSPGIWSNAFAIISSDTTVNGVKKYLSVFNDDLPKECVSDVIEWCRNKYHFVYLVRQWDIDLPRPTEPIFAFPVSPNKRLQFN